MAELEAQELAEIKARHVAQSWQDPGLKCDWDFMRWPCDAARLVTRMEELEEENARLRPLGDWGAAHLQCHDCGEAGGEFCWYRDREFTNALKTLSGQQTEFEEAE